VVRVPLVLSKSIDDVFQVLIFAFKLDGQRFDGVYSPQELVLYLLQLLLEFAFLLLDGLLQLPNFAFILVFDALEGLD
jgi:hypothetical protein